MSTSERFQYSDFTHFNLIKQTHILNYRVISSLSYSTSETLTSSSKPVVKPLPLRLCTTRLIIRDPSVSAATMELISTDRPGHAHSFKRLLNTQMVIGVRFHNGRCGRQRGLICGRDNKSPDAEICADVIEVITGGICQHDRARRFIHALAPDNLTVSVLLQQLNHRLRFKRQRARNRPLLFLR